MRAPTGKARHRKDGGVHVGGNAKHGINETRIEVDVRADRLGHAADVSHDLRTEFLDILEKSELVVAALLVGELARMGFRHLVFTDIARDGMRTGVNAQAYRDIARVAGFPVVASGGVATLDDLRALAALGDDVIEGAITGRALYEGAFTLEDALSVCAKG